MTIRGHSIIAGVDVPGNAGKISAINPTTDKQITPEFTLLDSGQLQQATGAASKAFKSYRHTDPETRAKFLDQAAREIELDKAEIVQCAQQETGLSEARLTGELGRTANQLRLFAEVVRQGDFNGVRIDPARPDRQPAPRLDIRQRLIPLGPVAVFGASNFPLAFSTAGGDTASALAAGCPVIVKAHNAHPGTGELVARAMSRAVKACDLDPGVFSIVYGQGTEIGQQLVADPHIAAVGFTGSRAGGLALTQTAATRDVPIPVYAEMSSINPVYILPGALDGDTEALATGYMGSVTGSSGQLCTAPGLVFLPSGPSGDQFVEAVKSAFADAVGQTMLTPNIAQAWRKGVTDIKSLAGVEEIATGVPGDSANAPEPIVFSVDIADFAKDKAFQKEIFGAASLLIRYRESEELARIVPHLEGQLTATLHIGDNDESAARALIDELELICGRILVGGWPTGVEVGHAMVHGGPFPSTTDSRTTSVGSLAIDRFLRPVAYQSMPESLLPPPLKEANPWGLNRRIDGQFTEHKQ